MLNDKIETAEVADAELDAISGGVGIAAQGGVNGGVALGVDGLAAVTDVTATVTSTVSGVASASVGGLL